METTLVKWGNGPCKINKPNKEVNGFPSCVTENYCRRDLSSALAIHIRGFQRIVFTECSDTELQELWICYGSKR